MKKTAVVLLSALLISNTCSIYASENFQSNEGITSEEENSIGFKIDHSFIDESGTMYYNLEYINELIDMDSFFYGFDNKTGTAYIQFSVLIEDYPEFAQYFLFKDGESIVKYNSGKEDLGKKVIVKDDNVFVPLRAFLNMLQIDDHLIIYYDDSKTVSVIKTNECLRNFRQYYYKKGRKLYLTGYEYSNLIRVNKNFKCFPEIYLVYDDVKYIKGTKNARSIAEYIKKNFDSSFDVSNYKFVDSFESAKTLVRNYGYVFYKKRVFNLIYQTYGIDTNSGYAVAYDDNNKVVAIFPYNIPVSQKVLNIKESDILSDEELYKKAVDDLKELTNKEDINVNYKSIKKSIDSATGKIKYMVKLRYMEGIERKFEDFEYYSN